ADGRPGARLGRSPEKAEQLRTQCRSALADRERLWRRDAPCRGYGLELRRSLRLHRSALPCGVSCARCTEGPTRRLSRDMTFPVTPILWVRVRWFWKQCAAPT